MKIQITTVAADAPAPRDVLVVAPGSATVREIAASLSDPARGDVVGPAQGPAPACYLGTRLLDPDTPLSKSGILDGCVIGVGAPVPAPDRSLGPERHEMPLPAERCERPGHAPLAELQVVGGPESGAVHLLGPGTHVVGPAPSASVQLTGSDVPKQGLDVIVRPDGSALVRFPAGGHARFSLPEPPPDHGRAALRSLLDVADLPDLLDGSEPEDEEFEPPRYELPPGWELWPFGAEVVLGESLLRLAEPTERDAAVVLSKDGHGLDYVRSPRALPRLQPESFRLPEPPTARAGRPIPLPVTLAPLVFGLIEVYYFASWHYLLVMILTPLMVTANIVSGRRSARRNYLEEAREYRLRRASLEADAEETVARERYQRTAAGTDPAVAALSAVGPGARLWERRRGDPDHLMLRIGTAAQPSLLEIKDAARKDNHQSVRWTIPDMPVDADLAGRGVVGIAGEGGAARALARWMTMQAAILHSPRDLRIVVLTAPSSADSWNWVRWLPHARSDGSGLAGGAGTLLGNDHETVANRAAELVSSLRARTKAVGTSTGGAPLNEPDLLVVFDGARALRNVPGVVRVLKEGPAVRIFALCVDSEERLLPEECTSVIRYEGRRLRLRVLGACDVTDIRPDLVSPGWCERAARGLAPIRDVTPNAA